MTKRTQVRVEATISEIRTQPKDLVFSLTLPDSPILSNTPRTFLINGKNLGSRGVVPEDEKPGQTFSQWEAAASTSFSEEFLKPEKLYEESAMYRSVDSEFFQDLDLWCSEPVKDESLQTIESAKATGNINNDTQQTQYSPHGWDVPDANSPLTPASVYTPKDSLSPLVDTQLMYSDVETQKFLDISTLPIVFGESALDTTSSVTANNVSWTDESAHTTYTHTPFIDQDETMDLKLGTTAVPRDIEMNDIIITDFVLNNEQVAKPDKQASLSIDNLKLWPDTLSTPDVLDCVELLDKQEIDLGSIVQWPTLDDEYSTLNSPQLSSSKEYSEPITPKSSVTQLDSDDDTLSMKRSRDNSIDSDDLYSPYSEKSTTRKYKRRKPSVPIKEMILALEEAQPPVKARRGRPPKRRDSNQSSIDVEHNSATPEMKYREIRDKNNEASKRSRMNRRLKELQMEQLAMDLEEKNKKLQIRAVVLEEMTKKLKDALMTAITKK